MSVIDTLIIDRTVQDAAKVVELAQKINAGTATSEELAAFCQPLKGAYTASDMNRVGEAMAYLRDRCAEEAGTALDVAPKTDWDGSDEPTPAQAARYIHDIHAVRDAFTMLPGTPEAPDGLAGLAYDKANAIEEIMIAVSKTLDILPLSLVTSGEVYGGEI